jgi:hypothetical protein
VNRPLYKLEESRNAEHLSTTHCRFTDFLPRRLADRIWRVDICVSRLVWLLENEGSTVALGDGVVCCGPFLVEQQG